MPFNISTVIDHSRLSKNVVLKNRLVAKTKNSSVWTESGYDLFAQEGLEGIQVERLARILQLNKSGFYHYFGDLEGFCLELLSLHRKKISAFLQDVSVAGNLDPEYLVLLVAHAKTIMFQVHLTRHKEDKIFYREGEAIDRRLDAGVQQLWCNYVGTQYNPDIAMRYYSIVWDRFYTRVTFENLHYRFLHDLVSDAKMLIHDIARPRSVEA